MYNKCFTIVIYDSYTKPQTHTPCQDFLYESITFVGKDRSVSLECDTCKVLHSDGLNQGRLTEGEGSVHLTSLLG